MGRCPVRSIFPEALEVLAKNQDQLRYAPFVYLEPSDPLADALASFMFDKIMPLAQAVEGYDLFDNMRVQKVIFRP
jgi:hypothetical protein